MAEAETTDTRLTVPVTGRIDSSGMLIAADPLLARLQIESGGTMGGMLAIPALAALCRLSRSLGMRLSRSIIAQDNDSNLDLWVETELVDEDVAFNIVDWQERPATDSQSMVSTGGQGLIRLDTALRIVEMRLPDFRRIQEFGQQPFHEIFNIRDALRAERVREALEERQALREVPVTLQEDSASAYLLSAEPLIDAAGRYAGYRGEIRVDESAAVIAPAVATTPAPAFGTQLAPALRMPLSRIIANAETIGERLQGPLRGEYSAYAKDIAAAGRHLMELVEDLADLEAVEKQNFSVAADSIDLVVVVHQAAGLLSIRAAEHHIRFELPHRESALPATGEFRRVLQILTNLIGNAVRYSPDGSTIRISVERSGDFARVTVSDEGAGIDAADQARIFEKFERLGRSGDGGTGLGLFISRHLAEAMGGRLTVASEAGKGASFTLAIPARD